MKLPKNKRFRSRTRLEIHFWEMLQIKSIIIVHYLRNDKHIFWLKELSLVNENGFMEEVIPKVVHD